MDCIRFITTILLIVISTSSSFAQNGRSFTHWIVNKYNIFLAAVTSEPGPGHNAFFTEQDTTFNVHHAYTRSANGTSLLNIKPVYKDKDG